MNNIPKVPYEIVWSKSVLWQYAHRRTISIKFSTNFKIPWNKDCSVHHDKWIICGFKVCKFKEFKTASSKYLLLQKKILKHCSPEYFGVQLLKIYRLNDIRNLALKFFQAGTFLLNTHHSLGTQFSQNNYPIFIRKDIWL